MKKLNLGVIILIAMVLGIATGLLAEFVLPEKFTSFLEAAIIPFGDVFITLIKMLVVPLVFVSIILGASSLGASSDAGKIGIGTITFYLVTSAVAVTFALFIGVLFDLGSSVDPSSLGDLLDGSNVYEEPEAMTFWGTVLSFIPTNPFEALVDGNMIQIIVFGLFLGVALSFVSDTSVKGGLEAVNDALLWMFDKIMLVAPIGVYALMTGTMIAFGVDLLQALLSLFLVYTAALLVHTFGFYGLIVAVLGKMNPIKFFSKFGKVQAFALSSSSSAATIPYTKECLEDELDVHPEVTAFTVPLGATINMDGNAIYYALAAIFFANITGTALGMSEYITIILVATIGSIGQAGVPGPSLLIITVLTSVGIPIDLLPILFGADRLFDMLRTATNVTGDATCSVVVDRFVDN